MEIFSYDVTDGTLVDWPKPGVGHIPEDETLSGDSFDLRCLDLLVNKKPHPLHAAKVQDQQANHISRIGEVQFCDERPLPCISVTFSPDLSAAELINTQDRMVAICPAINFASLRKRTRANIQPLHPPYDYHSFVTAPLKFAAIKVSTHVIIIQ